ncbi:MAG: signal peptidase II [Actinomycetaceae bacterium]|nr:signal peptidase II [Actinomycetaceae bacterium]MDY5853935.1 signal peptidase II [Arcanobacterium sp.]
MKKKTTRVAALLLVAVVAVVIDQLSKMWAVNALTQPRPLIGDVISLQLIHNSGAAFSLGAGQTWIFTLIALVACVLIPVFLFKAERWGVQVAIAMIWAGAAGNLIDRLFREPGFGVGHVVDFINYAGLFIGNVADIELFFGVIALVLIEVATTSGAVPADTTSAVDMPAKVPADVATMLDADGERRVEAAGGAPADVPTDELYTEAINVEDGAR